MVFLQVALILGIGLFIFIIAFLGIKLVMKELRKKLNPIAEKLGGKVVSGKWDIWVEAVIDDFTVKIKLRSPSQYNRETLYINVVKPFIGKFTVKRRSKLDEIFSTNRIVKTHDPEFDRDYIIKSPVPVQVSPHFQDVSRRSAIRFFFENGFNTLQYNGREFVFTKEGYSKEDIRPERMEVFVKKTLDFIR